MASTSFQNKHFNLFPIALHLPHLYHLVMLSFCWLFIRIRDFASSPKQTLLTSKVEAKYSEYSRTSKTDFYKTVNEFHPLTIFTKSSILGVRLSSSYASAENLFHIASWNLITEFLFLIFCKCTLLIIIYLY